MKRVKKKMKRTLKPVVILLLYFMLSAKGMGQTGNSFPDILRQRFTAWSDSVRWEEVYVSTDRQEYISGENMWFSIFLIDRKDNKPSLRSRIVYFELLSPGNMPVYQKRILIDKGFGPGQIVIPDTLSSGTYTVRAYTNRMKNFLPENCFMKEIKIYNAFNDRLFKERVPAIELSAPEVSGFGTSDAGEGILTLKADNSRKDTLNLYVQRNKMSLSDGSRIFYLFIQTRGNISRISTESFTGETTTVRVPKGSLIPGVNQFTLFDYKGNAAAERLLFIQEREKDQVTISVSDSISARSKVLIEALMAGDSISGSDQTRLSFSVALAGDNKNIYFEDYVVFGSEYGQLPADELRGRRLSEVSCEEIDSILLKVKSNRINWKSVLSGDLPHLDFPYETESNFLSGRLLTAEHTAPGSSQYLFLCIPGKNTDIQYAKTDRDGKFSFSLNIDEKQKNLIIVPEKPENFKINIESSFSDKYFQSGKLPVPNVDSIPSSIYDLSFNYQVMKNYGISSRGNRLSSRQDTLKPRRFYGKPDISLALDEYIRLPKMEEIFFELLPHINLKKRNSVYEITISDRVDNSPIISYPLIMIDGVIIKDASLIADLDPELVEKIDVVKGKYLVGDYLFPGIVNVITRAGDFNSVPPPDYMVRMTYWVTDPVVTFNSPDYSTGTGKSSHIPDFRNTLYWNPSAVADKNGKVKAEFWSSDVLSDYEIIINGFDAHGHSVSARKTINVKLY